MVVSGNVRNGVVVPESDVKLTGGTCVEILASEISSVLQAEFDASEAASDEDFATFEVVLRKKRQDA